MPEEAAWPFTTTVADVDAELSRGQAQNGQPVLVDDSVAGIWIRDDQGFFAWRDANKIEEFLKGAEQGRVVSTY